MERIIMTQYTEEVAMVLRRQAVEKWAKGTQYIAAQDGYVETALNDGSVTREYHRVSPCGNYGLGDRIVLQEADPFERLLDCAPLTLTE
jgi:hypothetical protein|tara:strand:+ start:476 stop:742 length:267 start_codon:yes stop_codon:yes gene_type:complete